MNQKNPVIRLLILDRDWSKNQDWKDHTKTVKNIESSSEIKNEESHFFRNKTSKSCQMKKLTHLRNLPCKFGKTKIENSLYCPG